MEPAAEMDLLRPLDPLNAEWVTLLLLIAFFMLAVINMNSPRKWRLLSQAMFRKRLGRQALREEVDLRDRTFVVLLLVAVAVLALFIWQLVTFATAAVPPAFPAILVGALALVAAQAMLVWLLGALVKADGGLLEHLYSGLLLFILAGVLLLPLVVLIAYRPEWRAPLFWTGMVVLVSSLLFRWLRAIWIGSGEGVPARYIIIYLCGAEILPLLLLIHALRPSFPTLSHL
jgi:hypothetical protein